MTLYNLIYWAHIVTGMVTFFIGPLQFISFIRENYTEFHRLLGRLYMMSVLISAPTGFIISFKTPLALAAAGTAIQSIMWFAATFMAYQAIKRKEIARHKRWMIRSYALVLAAPMVRISIIILEKWTVIDYMANFEFYYPLFVWISFLPLILAEAYLHFCKR